MMSALPVPGFAWKDSEGQNVLDFIPEAPFADVRLFARGPFLDGTGGMARSIRQSLLPLLGEPSLLLAPKQVHGTTILDSEPENALPHIVEADGVFLTRADMEASLRFADCAPVVLMPSASLAERTEPWVLLLHSGFKGTVQNIVKAGAQKISARYGDEALSELFAWVGPCIGGGNYPRRLEEWTERGLRSFHEENVYCEEPHFYFDIAAELRLQLLKEGLDEERIFMAYVDTFDQPESCYSYRRGDREDRMFLWTCLNKSWPG
ncbi:MAG: polyphenol oxidase family protein [Fretibacterium sp.]|nr:polyphenol oxidase family protein [Fretibacterium sp.]